MLAVSFACVGWSLPRDLGKLTPMSTNADRLGKAVLARRKQLDVTQMEVWQSGGPSNTTLTAIENGETTSLVRATARKLDVGLRWEPGSAKRVWEGGDPTPLPAPTPDEFSAEVLASDLSETTKRFILERMSTERDRPVRKTS